MKKAVTILLLIIFQSSVFGQEQSLVQEEQNLIKIQEQAIMDAKADFTTLKKLQWGFAAIAVPFGISALIIQHSFTRLVNYTCCISCCTCKVTQKPNNRINSKE